MRANIIPTECPNCRAVFEKNYGCDHIECPFCKTHFCYQCRIDFGTDGHLKIYDHLKNVHGAIHIEQPPGNNPNDFMMNDDELNAFE